MNYQNRVFIIRTFGKGEKSDAYASTPFYYHGENRFEPFFTTAVRFRNRQLAEQEISNLSSERLSYLEIIEVFANF